MKKIFKELSIALVALNPLCSFVQGVSFEKDMEMSTYTPDYSVRDYEFHEFMEKIYEERLQTFVDQKFQNFEQQYVESIIDDLKKEIKYIEVKYCAKKNNHESLFKLGFGAICYPYPEIDKQDRIFFNGDTASYKSLKHFFAKHTDEIAKIILTSESTSDISKLLIIFLKYYETKDKYYKVVLPIYKDRCNEQTCYRSASDLESKESKQKEEQKRLNYFLYTIQNTLKNEKHKKQLKEDLKDFGGFVLKPLPTLLIGKYSKVNTYISQEVEIYHKIYLIFKSLYKSARKDHNNRIYIQQWIDAIETVRESNPKAFLNVVNEDYKTQIRSFIAENHRTENEVPEESNAEEAIINVRLGGPVRQPTIAKELKTTIEKEFNPTIEKELKTTIEKEFNPTITKTNVDPEWYHLNKRKNFTKRKWGIENLSEVIVSPCGDLHFGIYQCVDIVVDNSCIHKGNIISKITKIKHTNDYLSMIDNKQWENEDPKTTPTHQPKKEHDLENSTKSLHENKIVDFLFTITDFFNLRDINTQDTNKHGWLSFASSIHHQDISLAKQIWDNRNVQDWPFSPNYDGRIKEKFEYIINGWLDKKGDMSFFSNFYKHHRQQNIKKERFCHYGYDKIRQLNTYFYYGKSETLTINGSLSPSKSRILPKIGIIAMSMIDQFLFSCPIDNMLTVLLDNDRWRRWPIGNLEGVDASSDLLNIKFSELIAFLEGKPVKNMNIQKAVDMLKIWKEHESPEGHNSYRDLFPISTLPPHNNQSTEDPMTDFAQMRDVKKNMNTLMKDQQKIQEIIEKLTDNGLKKYPHEIQKSKLSAEFCQQIQTDVETIKDIRVSRNNCMIKMIFNVILDNIYEKLKIDPKEPIENKSLYGKYRQTWSLFFGENYPNKNVDIDSLRTILGLKKDECQKTNRYEESKSDR